MENKLDCTSGWVKIETIIDEDSNMDAVKLTTDIAGDEGEVALTLSYGCKDLQLKSFNNLCKQNPDEIKNGILQMLGF